MLLTGKTALLAILLISAVGATAHAQDVVEVTNGDRIKGTVRGLERARLSFRTDAAGTISITWSEVVTIASSENLDVELVSGDRYSGTISSPAPGQLIVQTASGPTQPIPLETVSRMTPIAATFLARTSGSVDFGGTFTTADGARTYSLDATAANRTRATESEVQFASWFQRSDGANTLTRNDLDLVVRRFLPRRWFWLAKFAVQEDNELDLDWRALAGGGIGRRVVQSNQVILLVQGGLDYAGESYGGEDSTDHSAELFAGFDWDYFSPTWASDATVAATTYISLERQRMRLDVDAQVRRDIFWSMYWSINLFDNFDSDPPGDRKRNNLGVAFKLGWTF